MAGATPRAASGRAIASDPFPAAPGIDRGRPALGACRIAKRPRERSPLALLEQRDALAVGGLRSHRKEGEQETGVCRGDEPAISHIGPLARQSFRSSSSRKNSCMDWRSSAEYRTRREPVAQILGNATDGAPYQPFPLRMGGWTRGSRRSRDRGTGAPLAALRDVSQRLPVP